MRNLKNIFAVVAIGLLTSFSAFAVDTEPKTTNEKIREKIVNLIGDKISVEITKDTSVEISFMFNNKSEVVIISVDSTEDSVDTFIKSKLNYKNLNVKGVQKGEIYRVPLTLKKV